MSVTRALWVVAAVVWLGLAFLAGMRMAYEEQARWLKTMWCMPMTEIKPPPEPDISPLRLDA